MNAVSPSAIVGKWKLIESRSDLNKPDRVQNGRRGEVVEFTADGWQRVPGAKPSRSKSLGEVLYRLDTKRNPPQIDTSYAGGMALRTGIYRLEGDRLVICTTVADMGRRPKKFGGFTAAEKDLLRCVDIYERVTAGASKRVEVAKPAHNPPAVRLLEMKRLSAYLQKSRKTPPRDCGAGLPGEWIQVAELDVISGSMWAGNPLCLNQEDGCLVKLPAGAYVLAAQGMEFDGFRVVGRVRVYPKALSADRLKTGRAIGKTGTDSAAITVCDLRGVDPFVTERESAFQRELEKQLRGRCGLLISKVVPGVVLPFVQSGFGDGTGPVYSLQASGRRVGFELSFVEG